MSGTVTQPAMKCGNTASNLRTKGRLLRKIDKKISKETKRLRINDSNRGQTLQSVYITSTGLVLLGSYGRAAGVELENIFVLFYNVLMVLKGFICQLFCSRRRA